MARAQRKAAARKKSTAKRRSTSTTKPRKAGAAAIRKTATRRKASATRRGGTSRELPEGYKACTGGACIDYKTDKDDKTKIYCDTTDSCKDKSCECNLFSYAKAKDPWTFEGGPGQRVKKKSGRTYQCLCTTKT